MPFGRTLSPTSGLLAKAQAALNKTGVASILLCEGPACRRFAVQARWLRRDGIHVIDSHAGSAWFCSQACLGEALSMRLQASVTRVRVASVPPRMPFRLALLRAGAITDAALQAALERSRQTGAGLGTLLLHEGAITAEQLAAARAAERGCAHYTLPPLPVAAEFTLPLLLAQRFGAAMLHAGSGRCVLGFVERIDRRLMAMVEAITGLRVEAAFITEAYRVAQLAAAAGASALPIAPSASSASSASIGCALPAQAAAVALADYASKSGAEQMSLAIQPGLVWARFSRHSAEFFDQVLLLEEQLAAFENARFMREA